MSPEEFIHHYQTKVVGWLELRASAKGVRSISFISQPSQPVKSTQHPIMQELISELHQYFANKLTSFSVPLGSRDRHLIPAPSMAGARIDTIWKDTFLS